MVSLLYLVDLHARKSVLDKLLFLKDSVDLVVFGGDLTNFHSLDKAVEILKYARELFGKEIFFVPGNCDDPKLLEWGGESGITPLHMKVIEFAGLNFAGVGGSNITPFNTYIEFNEKEIREMVKHFVEKNIDVFVSHIPPQNTKMDRVYMGHHVGSSELKKFIETNQPRLVLTGHIHEGQGVDKVKKTTLVNPGPASSGRYALIKIGKNLEVNLGKV